MSLELFDGVHVRALAGNLRDIHKVVPSSAARPYTDRCVSVSGTIKV